ncbi:hypothetical protein EDC04DRAFT_3121906 [Pisolithus marmoratus]|nr:hypothetical protein EDC04DRAFT_3121906 [Pisolithus marmoratus]
MTMLKLVKDSIPPIEEFTMMCYHLDMAAVLHKIKVAMVEHLSEVGLETGKWIAEMMQNFISFMNALKPHLHVKDQLHPILQELVTRYARYVRFKGSKDYDGRSHLHQQILTFVLCHFDHD